MLKVYSGRNNMKPELYTIAMIHTGPILLTSSEYYSQDESTRFWGIIIEDRRQKHISILLNEITEVSFSDKILYRKELQILTELRDNHWGVTQRWTVTGG